MNIFELILSDPFSYQQVSSDLSNHYSNWSIFKQNMKILFSVGVQDTDHFIIKSRQLWMNAGRASPQIIQLMIEYYQDQLDRMITTVLNKKMSEISEGLKGMSKYLEMEITSQLQAVGEIYEIHQRYISLFDKESRYRNIFRNKIYLLLQKYEIRSKVYNLLQQAYQKNSLGILQSQILQFQESVIEYVREKSISSQNFNLQPAKIRKIFEYLLALGCAQEFFQLFYDFLNKDSENFIKNCTSLSEAKDFLTKCLSFERSFQKNFIKSIKSQRTEQFFNRYLDQLDDNTYYLYAKHCSKNILDIVLDFPESVSIILALKKCLDKAPLLSQVGEYLTRQIQKRLLIPGVITHNILNQYITLLKVLQIIDPQGIIFDKITLPIKNYLLKRNDTLRCIISHLTDDVQNYSKLTMEVVKIPSKEYIEEMSSDEDQNQAKQWQILPEKQQKMKKRIKYQEIDLVTVLVGLYGSQQAFISEYQNMMAEKLMSVKDFNIDEEVRNIELLKMRFGESALQVCDIIVKDVKDSKKNDAVIHQKKSQHRPGAISLSQLNCLSVSKGYWPINYENTSSFNIPPELKNIFQQYASRYSAIKAMRKIFFHYNLGHVNISLTFDNGQFQFKCLPIQAIMITYFDEQKIKDPKSGVSSQQLSNYLQISQNIVKQKMSFWVHKGVVKETRMPKTGNLSLRRMNSFQDAELIYYKAVSKYENIIKDQIDDDFESTLLKESTSMESHLRHIIEGLIISILNTNGPKSPEKIHLLLKTVYKTDLDYTYGEAQTTDILKKMFQKKKINFNGEVYSPKQQ